MNFNLNNNKGVAMILTILLMTLILFLSLYLLNFSLTEDRIAKSQSWGAKTYYLAEAGIQEMVWKLKHDAAYKTSFETNPAWSASFTRPAPFGAENGSYTASISNNGLAHGVITSTGTIDLGGGKTSQRIVKTFVFRALGQSGVQDSAGYADGDVNLSGTKLNIINGSLRSNINVIINLSSVINIEDDLNASNNVNISGSSVVTVGGATHSQGNPPAAVPLPMPAVDFDSADPNSLKNTADNVYTKAQFDGLVAANPHLILNGITYVNGDIVLKCDRKITINGILVSDRDINIGDLSVSCLAQCGQNDVTVNHAAGQASGILAKRKINFSVCTGKVNINGIVYADDELKTISIPDQFDVNGGFIGRKLTVTSVWQPMNITHNNEYLVEVLGATEYSPLITVEHWEEEY